jgi:integrase
VVVGDQRPGDRLAGVVVVPDRGGRTFDGVAIRIAQRILAMAAAIWHNNNTGQPVTRSLIAYDHWRSLGIIRLVLLLRSHLERYGTGSQGRVFVGARGGALTDRSYLAVFHQARAAAFGGPEAASLLARRPYDLRHAAVSTWLNAGVAPPQVAEWAGHSVEVLLRVYAKCISGKQDEAMRRILEATAPDDGKAASEPGGIGD